MSEAGQPDANERHKHRPQGNTAPPNPTLEEERKQNQKKSGYVHSVLCEDALLNLANPRGLQNLMTTAVYLSSASNPRIEVCRV